MLKNIHQSDFISLYVCIFASGNCSTAEMNTDVRFTVRGLRKQGPNVGNRQCKPRRYKQSCGNATKLKQICAVLFF